MLYHHAHIDVDGGHAGVAQTRRLEAISCTVRWTESNQCGLQFERPIYEPVVEHLCRLHVRMGGEVQDYRARTRGICAP
jgi:hypothetical protein